MEKKPFLTEAMAQEIIQDVPTPFHVYDEKGIRENARRINKAFSWNKGFKEYFAVKALPNPVILQILKEEGCGVELAQGGTLDGYRERTHMVVEGALACKTLKTLSEAYNVELPITDVVRGVVWEGADPKAAAKDLFARPLTTEFYGL